VRVRLTYKLKSKLKLRLNVKMLPAVVCVLMLLTSGCGTVMYFVWPFGRTVTIPAAFDGLKNHSVAVVVFARESTQFEYPWVGMNLSAMTSSRLRAGVKDVTTVDAQKINAYQRKNLHWVEMDRTALGKALDADFVLYISLVEFSTVEAGYVDLLRGRINGEIKIYDCSKSEDNACVWTCDSILVEFPKTATVRTVKNEADIRSVIMVKFSEKLAKKFYSYTVDREDLDKENL
jgi:hypothetical protein